MIEDTKYGMRITVPGPVAAAVDRITAALREEGFGVLTTIDVAATLRAKLGRERAPYVILGACNPHLADRAIDAEPEIGLLLPCNVIVHERADGAVTIAAIAPLPAMSVVGNPALLPVAGEADERLRRALARVAAGAPPA